MHCSDSQMFANFAAKSEKLSPFNGSSRSNFAASLVATERSYSKLRKDYYVPNMGLLS